MKEGQRVYLYINGVVERATIIEVCGNSLYKVDRHKPPPSVIYVSTYHIHTNRQSLVDAIKADIGKAQTQLFKVENEPDWTEGVIIPTEMRLPCGCLHYAWTDKDGWHGSCIHNMETCLHYVLQRKIEKVLERKTGKE